MAPRPLSGLTVVDISTSYAGPFCSLMLADLGADVIKVEKPGGDDARTWGPPFIAGESAWFLSVNRNKRSLCLDFSVPEGRAILDRILARSDVLVENLKPGSLAKFGLDYETVHARHPHLVYAAISGFGLTGPEAHRTGYDLIAQALSGLMSVTGGPDGEPQRVGTALSDIVTGIVAALGVTALLVARGRHGEGGLVDASLLDVDVALMTPRIVSYLASGVVPVPTGGTDSVIALYQKVRTADEPIVLATGTPVLWDRFKKALGSPPSLERPEYATNAGRQTHRAALVDEVERLLAQHPAAYWVDRFRAFGVPCARINYLDGVVREAQLLARDMFPTVSHPVAGTVKLVGSPLHLDGSALPIRRPPPLLGQHSVEVLQECGFAREEIEGWLARGIVYQNNRPEPAS